MYRTVSEKNVGSPKVRNDLIVHWSNMGIALLDFSLLLPVKLSILIFSASLLMLVLCFFISFSLYSLTASSYCNSHSCSSFSLLESSKTFFAIVCRSWKSGNYTSSNTEKKPWTCNVLNRYKSKAKRLRSTTFLPEFGRALTITQYWKNEWFDRASKLSRI